jgi:hypothetical protein
MGVVGWLWTWWFLPDTKGRSLEELDELFLKVLNVNFFHITASILTYVIERLCQRLDRL